MNTTQVAARKPGINAKNVSQLCHSFHSRPCTLPMGFDPLSVKSMSLGTKPSSGLQCLPILKSEDGGFAGMSYETLQVVLATISFIFLYILFINGLELAMLASDCIKFMFGGRRSVRLKRATYKWSRFYKNITEKKSRMDRRKPPHGCSSLVSSEVYSLLRHYRKSYPDE